MRVYLEFSCYWLFLACSPDLYLISLFSLPGSLYLLHLNPIVNLIGLSVSRFLFCLKDIYYSPILLIHCHYHFPTHGSLLFMLILCLSFQLLRNHSNLHHPHPHPHLHQIMAIEHWWVPLVLPLWYGNYFR